MELDGSKAGHVITTLAQLEKLKSILHSPNCNMQRLKIDLGNEKKDYYDSLQSFCEDLAAALLRGRCGGLLDLDLSLDLSDSLLDLDVSANRIRSAIVKILATALASHHCNIQSLNLYGNYFGDEGAKILAEALASGNCALRSLDLGQNKITDEGTESLANAVVSENCALGSLHLDYNHIRDRGTKYLADALLSGRCGLLDLSLKGNYPFETEDTMKVLAAALASSHCKIQTLNLSHVNRSYIVRFGAKIAINMAEALLSGNCALVSLNLRVNSIGNEGTQSLANAMSNTLCKLEYLNLTSNRITDKGATSLALALSSQDCRLRHLVLEKNEITETGKEALVNALRANVTCQINKLELDWTSSGLKVQFDKLVKRNAVFRNAVFDDVQPTDIAKLFLCGFSGVGKTTIRKNINKKLALRKYSEPHASTTGMDLQTLIFGKKKLLICDLAGQKEFHAFHHYFVRGSDKDLFLVVCKDTSPGYETQFQDDLRYWLRFIVCHRSSPSAPKPKVCIAVNYFSPFFDSDYMKKDAIRLTKSLVDEYQDFLDFGEEQKNIFGLVALNASQLNPLKAQLSLSLDKLLEKRQKIPKICSKVLMSVRKIARASSKSYFPFKNSSAKIVSFQDLEMTFNSAQGEVSPELLRYSLEHLFDMGELIFLNDVPHLIILDVQWFVRVVIGAFISPSKLLASENPVNFQMDNVLAVERRLTKDCHVGTQLKDIINILEALGVLQVQPNGRVLVPALLRERIEGWPKEGESFRFIGRRFACQEHTLLPSSIFMALQVKLKKPPPSGNRFGDGWISIMTNNVTSIVKVGGHTNDWRDRQWIDVMVQFPREHPGIEDLFRDIRQNIIEVCANSLAYVSLEEFLIKPESIGGLKISGDDVVLLSRIKDEAARNGSLYSHTWEGTSSKLSSTCVSELMFDKEWKEVFEDKLKLIEDLEHEVSTLAAKRVPRHDPLVESMEHTMHDPYQAKLDSLLQGQAEIKQEIQQGVAKILQGQEELKQKIDNKVDGLSRNVAVLTQICCTDLPCLPYLTDGSNYIQKITSGILGKSTTLHLLCESSSGHHAIANQIGITVKLPPKWLTDIAPVLAPALTCLALAARIASIVLTGFPSMQGFPKFLPNLINIAAENSAAQIQKIVVGTLPESPCLAGHAFEMPISEEQLKSFFSYIIDKETNKKISMEKDFGLYPVMCGRSPPSLYWLCADHCHEGQKQQFRPNFHCD